MDGTIAMTSINPYVVKEKHLINRKQANRSTTSISNISTDGAASRRTIIHNKSNSTKIPCRDNFLSFLKAVQQLPFRFYPKLKKHRCKKTT
jgi:hypothetical protein